MNVIKKGILENVQDATTGHEHIICNIAMDLNEGVIKMGKQSYPDLLCSET